MLVPSSRRNPPSRLAERMGTTAITSFSAATLRACSDVSSSAVDSILARLPPCSGSYGPRPRARLCTHEVQFG